MKKKQLVRQNFRDVCLKRDGYKCRKCGLKPEFDEMLDVHHIKDRTEISNGGYVLENGISLCGTCHLKAEKFHISAGREWEQGMHPDDLYRLIGSSEEKAERASEKL